ncbi:MAG: fasciclin domain-containing protein [Bacteroidales bacterium]|nr:fasciclin domain-containing protein [Bacteroidales bacterium]
MKKIIIYICMLSGILAVTGCKDPFEEKLFKAYDEIPIGLTLSGKPEYSLWVDMLKKADVYNALNLGITDFTLFAPNNDAVTAYLAQKGYESADDMASDDLDYLVRYHILNGKIFNYSDLLLKLPVATVSGDYLTAGINLEDGRRYIDNGDGRTVSYVIDKDIDCSNGIIQGVDHMLEPITETLWDILSTNPRYSIFAQAVQTAGLKDFIDETYVTINEITIRDNKTVFAVCDSVFNAAGINSLSDLKVKLHVTKNFDSKDSDFYHFVAYHLMRELCGYAELTTFPSGYKSMIKHTFSERKGFSILDAEGVVTINGHEAGKGFHIMDDRRDIPARNGYIHEIDAPGFLPDFMAHYIVVWEPTDKIEFAIIPFYREVKTSTSATQKYDIIENELKVPGIRWESIPEAKAKVWYHSQYLGGGRFKNHDALYWNMGTIGWLEMDVPVMPTGKYTICAEKLNDSSLGGKGPGMWDAEDLRDGAAEINFANGSAYATWRTVTISREETHIIRFIVGSSGADFGIDRFEFIPVD